VSPSWSGDRSDAFPMTVERRDTSSGALGTVVTRLRRVAYRVLRRWWQLWRPIMVGVRVLMVRDGRVLLVRHTYQDAWYLPGGGVKRGETLEEAIRREAAEEVGATLGTLSLLGVYTNLFEGKCDHVAAFVCRAFALSGETDGEIEQYAFFEPEALPADASPGTRRRVGEYIAAAPAAARRW
jgi:8-oxo-dGTP pyrophosphatase MutT (NUDIX family)